MLSPTIKVVPCGDHFKVTVGGVLTFLARMVNGHLRVVIVLNRRDGVPSACPFDTNGLYLLRYLATRLPVSVEVAHGVPNHRFGLKPVATKGPLYVDTLSDYDYVRNGTDTLIILSGTFGEFNVRFVFTYAGGTFAVDGTDLVLTTITNSAVWVPFGDPLQASGQSDHAGKMVFPDPVSFNGRTCYERHVAQLQGDVPVIMAVGVTESRNVKVRAYGKTSFSILLEDDGSIVPPPPYAEKPMAPVVPKLDGNGFPTLAKANTPAPRKTRQQ